MITTCTKTEYALRKGVSRPAISQAIASGRVVVLPDGRVDVEASDRVWERKTDAMQSARANAPKRRAFALAEDTRSRQAGDVPTGSPAVAERDTPRAADIGPPVPRAQAETETPRADDDSGAPGLSRVIYDFESARAKRETHAANIAEMEERKRAGELCETSAVMMVLTTIGSNFRTALERVADKLADRVAAETDPHACHQIISGEILQALDQLSMDCEAAGPDLVGDRNGRG